MAIADDRKTITDNDIRSVIATVRSVQITTVMDVVDPFDTPAAPLHAHEAGYGHGV
jgi:hypothetical protein